MASEPPEIYAVCPMDAIPIGGAQAFDLARVETDGTSRPFRIFVVREKPTTYRGYLNRCPHEETWLNIGSGSFLDPSGGYLRCGRHGARFEIATGLCLEGPCAGASLEPVAVVAVNGDVCLAGVVLVEDDRTAGAARDAVEETMEITVHPG